MSPQEIAAVRSRLLQMREEALSAPAARIEPNRKDPTTVGIADEDEQALSEMMQALASEHNKKQAELIAHIDRALRKIDAAPGDFGLCEDCEEEIPERRLQVMPYATLCAECQGRRDPRRGQARKHITDFK